MKQVLLFVLLFVFACKEKPKEKTVDQRINEIAAPLIANEVGDLNILVATAKDRSLSTNERANAIFTIRDKFSEFLGDDALPKTEYDKQHYTISPDSVYSKQYTDRIEKQRQYIEQKYKKYAAGVVYKQELTKQYEAK